MDNPFKEAKDVSKRFKVLLYGGEKVGKTYLALQFPNPVVIDLESGLSDYNKKIKFDVLPDCNSSLDVMRGIDYLLKENHEYRTLIIDPITKYWDIVQEEWTNIFLKRKKSGHGYKYDYYELQPGDWRTIKAYWKSFIRKINLLDMNVIMIAREKTLYKEGEMMVPIGKTFDGEKSLPYEFDAIIHLTRDSKGVRMAEAISRGIDSKLPETPFECSYKVIAKYIGEDNLTKKSEYIERISEFKIGLIKSLLIDLDMTEEELNLQIKKKKIADEISLIPEKDSERVINVLKTKLEEKKKEE